MSTLSQINYCKSLNLLLVELTLRQVKIKFKGFSMRHCLSSFEIEEVEAESCLFVISDPMVYVVAYQILSKDHKIFLASR